MGQATAHKGPFLTFGGAGGGQGDQLGRGVAGDELGNALPDRHGDRWRADGTTPMVRATIAGEHSYAIVGACPGSPGRTHGRESERLGDRA
jgi:hypothetical protein